MKKTYLASMNYKVDAPVWWESAREHPELPTSLVPLVRGMERQVEITWDDLQWCKQRPHWDGLDGWPLKLTRLT